MPRQKIVDNVYVDLTAEELEAEAADIAAMDLDMTFVRIQRNEMLSSSDWTQIGDATLGDHTAEEWRTYRQALKDIPQNHTRVSEVVWPNDPPTQAAIDAAAD